MLVLDEVDGLAGDALRRVFGWAAMERSRLVVIGVANALQLPTAQPGVASVLFKPYSHVELYRIVARRLVCSVPPAASDGKVAPVEVSFVKDAALSLCARWAQNKNGDARAALGMCGRALAALDRSYQELAPSSDAAHPAHKRPRIAASSVSGSSAASVLLAFGVARAESAGPRAAPVVDVGLMSRLITAALHSAATGTPAIAALSPHGQFLLCIVAAVFRRCETTPAASAQDRKNSADVTVSKVSPASGNPQALAHGGLCLCGCSCGRSLGGGRSRTCRWRACRPTTGAPH